jgi:hypothetical protein
VIRAANNNFYGSKTKAEQLRDKVASPNKPKASQMNPKTATKFARRMSWPKRNILFDHLLALSLPMPYGAAQCGRLKQTKWLILMGLLARGGERTTLTDDGRRVVRVILADCDDVLSRFGMASTTMTRPIRGEPIYSGCGPPAQACVEATDGAEF